ncbi:hypothetical protein ACB098_07G112300 [Castanea mollissima]
MKRAIKYFSLFQPIQTYSNFSQSKIEDFHEIDVNFLPSLYSTLILISLRHLVKNLGLAYFHKGYQFLYHSFNHYTNKNMCEREREREYYKRQSRKSGEFVEQNRILNNIALQIDHPTTVPSSSFNLCFF